MSLKQELVEELTLILDSKIASIKKDIELTQKSANEETKSSMGDKYETGRAMAQNEKLKKQSILNNFLLLKKTLIQITFNDSEKIQFGSLVALDQMNVFISIALGEIEYKGNKYFCISPTTPLGKKLINKVKGDEIKLNKQVQILKVQNA